MLAKKRYRRLDLACLFGEKKKKVALKATENFRYISIRARAIAIIYVKPIMAQLRILGNGYIGEKTQTVFSQLHKKKMPSTITVQIVANCTNVRSSSSIMYNCLCFATGVK